MQVGNRHACACETSAALQCITHCFTSRCCCQAHFIIPMHCALLRTSPLPSTPITPWQDDKGKCNSFSEGERWLDVRSNQVRRILEARIKVHSAAHAACSARLPRHSTMRQAPALWHSLITLGCRCFRFLQSLEPGCQVTEAQLLEGLPCLLCASLLTSLPASTPAAWAATACTPTTCSSTAATCSCSPSLASASPSRTTSTSPSGRQTRCTSEGGQQCEWGGGGLRERETVDGFTGMSAVHSRNGK